MKKLPKIILFILICEAAGIIGSAFTFSSIPTWYATLIKPSFSPPNWIFGPVWTLLYAMMGISLFLVWEKGIKNKEVVNSLKMFTVQLTLNTIWSILFFGFKNPLLALIEIIILWIFILLTILKFYKLTRPAGYLLVPYLIWVSFATLLNLSIVILN